MHHSALQRQGSEKSRLVSQLRPNTPVILEDTCSILDAAQQMHKQRCDVALLIREDELTGILTDNDITRRVVAAGKDLNTSVSEVMTQHPNTVRLEDTALNALNQMVEGHFRHLPVLDHQECLVGVLDIAKCLFDVISRLEKLEASGSLQNVFEQVYGEGGIPTLHALITELNRDVQTVISTDSVKQAAEIIKDHRKAVLVIDSDHNLVGILTPKDILDQAVSQNLPADSTNVELVMTRDPETIDATCSLLDSLHQMHDGRFLHLPVIGEEGIIGMVDVMDIITYMMTGESGNLFWEAGFGEDDNGLPPASLRNKQYGNRSASYHSERSQTPAQDEKDSRPVSKLRPLKPLTFDENESIESVAKQMASHRSDCALLTKAEMLTGILTDSDVTRRVVAKSIDLQAPVKDVMTQNPDCTHMGDRALDALQTMVQGHFRHLPVKDNQECIVGVLDIARCLFDVIKRLDRMEKKAAIEREKKLAEVERDCKAAGADAEQIRQLRNMVLSGDMSSKLFGVTGVPTLQKLVDGLQNEIPIVNANATVTEAAGVINQHKKAVLVTGEENELIGILTPNDILTKVIAKSLPADETVVSDVMIPDPDTLRPETTVLDALHLMHDRHYLHVPVVDGEDNIYGVVDVVEIVSNIMHGEAGELFWSAIYDDEGSEEGSLPSVKADEMVYGAPVRAISAGFSDRPSSISSRRSEAVIRLKNDPDAIGDFFTFKVKKRNGDYIRLPNVSADDFKLFSQHIIEHVPEVEDPDQIKFEYTDNDGDKITISRKEDLIEAVAMARSESWGAIKLEINFNNEPGPVAPANPRSEGNFPSPEFFRNLMNSDKGPLIGAGIAILVVTVTTVGVYMMVNRSKRSEPLPEPVPEPEVVEIKPEPAEEKVDPTGFELMKKGGWQIAQSLLPSFEKEK